MAKTVQIPLDTFYDLIRVHLLDQNDPDTMKRISSTLERKLDTMTRREYYSTYKNTSLTDAERQEARLKYLDAAGIPDAFRS
ncbi:MAG: complexin-2 [Eubacterium sp.]|nr:complexin-2 [Eubacterium sp.]